MSDMKDLRARIDEIDSALIKNLEARFALAEEIAEVKQAAGLPIYDRLREEEKKQTLAREIKKDYASYVYGQYDLIFEQSRAHQTKILARHGKLYGEIVSAMDGTAKLFPPEASVACQGMSGAYSQQAAEKLFRHPSVMYFKSFESVFSAIEAGLCRYGVLPLENSTAGSVTKIYDLMQRHNFKIVRSARLKVDHSLLTLPDVKLSEIRGIVSHEQALSQCASYLEKLGPDVKITRVENTAVAAQMVQESGRRDLAAIASHGCAKLYGLQCLEADVQDRSNNYTRFICIAKNLEIYPGADRSSIMLVLPHQPGALHRVLSRFAALGINLNKLESRPIPERDFEFMFYFDLETSVYAEEFAILIDGLHEICDEFHYLGSYIEVI